MSFPSVPFQDLYWEIFWMNSQNPLHILFLLLAFTFFHVSVNSISLSLISLVTMFHLSDEATLACVKLTNYCHCLNLNLKIRQPNNKIHMLFFTFAITKSHITIAWNKHRNRIYFDIDAEMKGNQLFLFVYYLLLCVSVLHDKNWLKFFLNDEICMIENSLF